MNRVGKFKEDYGNQLQVSGFHFELLLIDDWTSSLQLNINGASGEALIALNLQSLDFLYRSLEALYSSVFLPVASNVPLYVKVWFQNRRTKHKRMQQEEKGGGCGSGDDQKNPNESGHTSEDEDICDEIDDEDDEVIDMDDCDQIEYQRQLIEHHQQQQDQQLKADDAHKSLMPYYFQPLISIIL
uniref:Homeobox domain-containing protein n=1 Tax=Megaselia scalaris TaxID=36166 RepID=T1GRU5_MEGSC